MSDSIQYKLRENFQDDDVALFQIAGGACTAALTTLIIVLSCEQYLEKLTAPENEIQIKTERKQTSKLSFRDRNHNKTTYMRSVENIRPYETCLCVPDDRCSKQKHKGS